METKQFSESLMKLNLQDLWLALSSVNQGATKSFSDSSLSNKGEDVSLH